MYRDSTILNIDHMYSEIKQQEDQLAIGKLLPQYSLLNLIL